MFPMVWPLDDFQGSLVDFYNHGSWSVYKATLSNLAMDWCHSSKLKVWTLEIPYNLELYILNRIDPKINIKDFELV